MVFYREEHISWCPVLKGQPWKHIPVTSHKLNR